MQHPLVFELARQPVVCVGGGPVATAKVGPMAAAGAVVTVISPTCDPALRAMVDWTPRAYTAGDLAGDPPFMLAVAATGIQAVDDAVAAEAADRGIWCLRIDGRGNVAVPSIIRRAGLMIALSTGAPALTRRLRRELEAGLDTRWGVAAKILSGLRADPEIRDVLAPLAPAERRARWRRAVDAVLDDGPLPRLGPARSALRDEDPPA